jgi:prophage regulatory protein
MTDLRFGRNLAIKPDRIIKLPELKEITTLSRTQIYRAIKERRFPRMIAIGIRSVGWRESEVEAWMQNLRPKTRNA